MVETTPIGEGESCIGLLHIEEKDVLLCRRNYTFAVDEWHVENESAFSVNRKGT